MKNTSRFFLLSMLFATGSLASECTPAGLLSDVAAMHELLVAPTTEHVRSFLDSYTDKDELQKHLDKEKLSIDAVVAKIIADQDKLTTLVKIFSAITLSGLQAGPDSATMTFQPAHGRTMEFAYMHGHWIVKN